MRGYERYRKLKANKTSAMEVKHSPIDLQKKEYENEIKNIA